MKKKDMTALIEGLRRVSDDFALIADALEGVERQAEQMPEEVPNQEAELVSEETADAREANDTVSEPLSDPESVKEAPAYSFEQVRGILADKSRSGHREQVKALIVKYGGEQLSDYKEKPDILAALVKDAEEF